jgi:hypothetical protein
MKTLHLKKKVCMGLAIGAIAIVLGAGCPRPQEDPALEFELIIGDAGLGPTLKNDAGTPFDYARILVYQDVLRGDSQQEPDLVLSGETIPELRHPIHMTASFGILWVCDDVTGTVLCWPNLFSIVTGHNDDPSPQFLLDGNGIIGEPVFVLMNDFVLFVADLSPNDPKACCGAIHLFVDPIYFHADQAPDRTLTEPATPVSLAFAGDQLYVADPGLDRVLVYTSVTDLLNPDKGPDAEYIELSGPSWLGLDDHGIVAPMNVMVFGNVLYVTTASNMLYAFSPADALQDFQEPDAVIAETNGALDAPMAMAQVGERLFVGNANSQLLLTDKALQKKENTVGMVAFDTAAGLVDGQQPSIVFDTANAQMSAVRHFYTAYDFLVSATAVPQDSPIRSIPRTAGFPIGDVHIHRHAEKLQQGKPGDLVLPAFKDFVGPLSMTGTFFIEMVS